MNLWPHQERAIAEFIDRIDLVADYVGRICLTSPTGGGKTVIAQRIIHEFLRRDLPVVIYTNRKMLREQMSRVFAEAGFDHGIRAAGVGRDSSQLLQISSIQTEHSKVTKRDQWKIHPAALVIVDEAHIQKGQMVETILKQHDEAKAVVLGLTATPLDLGEHYKHLIIAGKNSELRACGALVPAIHFGPDEPDLKGIKAKEGKDLTDEQNAKAMMRGDIFGRVLTEFATRNPERKPTLLFAPGVGESLWFCKQFMSAGIAAAHIDGKEICLDGQRYPSDEDMRAELAERSRDGRVKVICNRFIMREGIDFPWIEHIILATVFGSLQSYLQSGGRGLRAYPQTGKKRLTVSDHGGNWHRHKSLNEDRDWNLSLTGDMVTGMYLDRLRERKELPPVLCPQCKMVLRNKVCLCGFVVDRKTCTRPVVQTDGTLKMMSADPLRPRRICRDNRLQKMWENIYWASRKGKPRTFKEGAGFFCFKNNWQWPNPTWPLMPKNPKDWYRLVGDVPMSDLTSVPERKHGQDQDSETAQEADQAGVFAWDGPAGDLED